MSTSATRRVLSILTLLAATLALPSFRALAQEGTAGKVVITVEDASGAVVPGATLTLVEHQTNDTRTANTNGSGDYTFENLPIGVYTLTIGRSGYSTRVYSAVIVQAGQVTDLKAQLTVGSTTTTVQVTGQTSPVLQTTSNEIGTAIDSKQIQDLPIYGRDVSSLIQTVPGFQGQGGYGTFNGLPLSDQGNNLDGMVGSTERMKFGGNTEPAVMPRLEDIEQMSVQTDQLGLNSGFGQATTQLSFVTKRGTNHFHGLVYEDFQNDGLNANSWENDATGVRKNKLIRNDFGASVGGPVLRDKLFFFGSFATLRVPGTSTTSNNVFTTAAQAGNFTYGGNTVNLLTLAQNYNNANPTATPLPTTINPAIAQELSAINSAEGSGVLSATSDPNMQTLSWNYSNPDIEYYPVARLDYNLSQKARMYLTWSMTKIATATSLAPYLPGSGFSNETSGVQSRNFTGSYGFDYIFSPKLINQFKAGFLYDWTGNPIGGAPLYATENPIFWDYPGGNGNMSGVDFYGPITTYYPVYDFSDSITLQRGKHTFQFGGSWYKEQDHYWNGPGGYYNYSLGLASGDPAINAFSNGTGGSLPGATQTQINSADALYAILTGRISGVGGENAYNIKSQKYSPTGTPSEYPLDEVASNWSFFGEDSWRVTPTLTLNYGLRWDVYGAEQDLTGFYHSADLAAIYGPTPVGALFQPGNLGGVQDPQISKHTEPFAPWRVTPQPSFGFAWNPRIESGPLAGLLGRDKTVIRGGYALRRFTESYQYYWDYATDYGQFYYQQFNLFANNTGAPGSFAPGSLALGNAVPAPLLSPTAYADSYPEAQFTFTGAGGANGVQPNLNTPTSESWNFGIQRGLGHNLALEVRYNGNHTLHQWIALNFNEMNVFESGLLKDFQNAQKNLAASGGTSFAPSYGNSMPIITAAFGGPNASDFTNQQFIQYLQTGQVGSMAKSLSSPNGTVDYFCNLVGAGFSPCATTEGYTGAGAGYPINLLEANPYSLGTQTASGGGTQAGELASAGYSNYNGLQVDLRQGSWHGLQFDANYTWSHTLALESPNSWTGSFNAFTLRDLRRGYGPGPFDIRNVVHANGTYDLPFGQGRPYLNHSKALNAAVGGFTLGTIATVQTGAPVMLAGQYLTYNDYADSGVQLTGVTRSQLQSAIGLREDTGAPYVNLINPKYLASTTGGGANSNYVAPNITPGTFGQIVYLHGPHQFFQDMELTKRFPIHEAMNFNLQGAFINVWNHPAWGSSGLGGGYAAGYPSSFDNGIQDFNFGEEYGPSNGARVIEMRGNFVF
jgi:hypothetical protein